MFESIRQCVFYFNGLPVLYQSVRTEALNVAGLRQLGLSALKKTSMSVI
jgi:hypothetical protein